MLDAILYTYGLTIKSEGWISRFTPILVIYILILSN